MVDDRRLAALFRSASIVLSASEHEGCGLPLLEAMHHGVPVIARAAAAVPETVGDAAVLVDTAEPEAWARAVQAVLTDASLRQRLVSAGKRRAEERSRIDLAARLTELVG
jgi:glycosyltransferase involved in cell wall biosynthesis